MMFWSKIANFFTNLFKRKQPDSISINTLIGESSYIDGEIRLSGHIKIDGKVSGGIKTRGDIIISEKAVINGNVYGNNIFLSGTVKGNVTARSQLSLISTSKIDGDVKSKSLVVDEGATFSGNCTMGIEIEPIEDIVPTEE